MDSERKNSEPSKVTAIIVGGIIIIVFLVLVFNNFSSNSSDKNNSVTVSGISTDTIVQSSTSTSSGNNQYKNQQFGNAILNNPGNLQPSVIAEIEPSVVEINCYSADNSWESSGSGLSFLSKSTGINYIETNYHVYTGAIIGGLEPTCYAVFPKPSDFSYNAYYGDYKLKLNAWHYNSSTYEDAVLFTLESPALDSTPLDSIPVINNLGTNIGTSEIQCSINDVNVGDSITIFGYPASGNALGISETVTDGIISGILPGPIYKTNAAIDHGNSGGVAILNKKACALGIPTLGVSGLTSGIGYIQSYSLAEQAIQ